MLQFFQIKRLRKTLGNSKQSFSLLTCNRKIKRVSRVVGLGRPRSANRWYTESDMEQNATFILQQLRLSVCLIFKTMQYLRAASPQSGPNLIRKLEGLCPTLSSSLHSKSA